MFETVLFIIIFALVILPLTLLFSGIDLDDDNEPFDDTNLM